MKKRLLSILGILLVIGLSVYFLPSDSFAAEKTSSVTYQYVDIASLTQLEKEQIITSELTGTTTADKENILFIYQKEATPTTNQLVNNTVGKQPTTRNPSTTALPKAGAVPPSLLNYFLGFSLIILVIGLSLWKRKIRETLLLFILLGSALFSTTKNTYAAEKTILKPEASDIIAKGIPYNQKSQVIHGYTYIGYIIQKENDPIEIPVEKGNVTVNNMTAEGTLISSEIHSGNIGDTYEITPKEIDGYTLTSPKTPKTGKYIKTRTEIIFIYKKNVPIIETGTVIVKNMTEDGTLISSETYTGNVGDSYAISPKLLNDFDLVSSTNPKTGIYNKNGAEIIFYYKVKPRVEDIGLLTVKSIDEDGNLLYQIVTFSGKVGTTYEVAPMIIDGYTLLTPIGPQTGTYIKEGSELIFTYRKDTIVNVNLTIQNSNPTSTPTINTQTRGYIYPNYYKALYYDNQGNLLKTEEIHADTTLRNESFQYNTGENYSFYSMISFECYAVQTNERLNWGDYLLLTDTPSLTTGVTGSTDITINYTLYDLSYP